MLKIQNLTYIYPKNHLVLENLDWKVEVGEFWGILGRNGAGKSTLLDLILGLKYPTAGEISFSDLSKNEIVFLSQDIQLKGDVKVHDFLKFHSFFYKNYSKTIESELISYFDLDPYALIGALSTGQQKKVQAIAGLAANTKLIIIDEMTAVLDLETRFKFFAKLIEINKKDEKTIILATNIAEDLTGRADKILYINDFKGRIIDSSKIDEIFITS